MAFGCQLSNFLGAQSSIQIDSHLSAANLRTHCLAHMGIDVVVIVVADLAHEVIAGRDLESWMASIVSFKKWQIEGSIRYVYLALRPFLQGEAEGCF